MDADSFQSNPVPQWFTNFLFGNQRDWSSSASEMKDGASESRPSPAISPAVSDATPSNEALATQDREHKCTACDAVFPTGVDYLLHSFEKCKPEERRRMLEETKAISEQVSTGEIAHPDESSMEDSESVQMDEGESAEKRYECKFCVKRFPSEDALNSHLQEYPFKCELCERAFHTKTDLILHTLSHKKKRSYPCAVCNEEFPTRYRFKVHKCRPLNLAVSRKLLKGGIDPERDERPTCDLCLIQFMNKDDFHRHKKLHIQEKPYKCPYCPKTFSDESSFRKHKRIYSLICEICYEKFYQKSKYDKHIRTHGSEEKQRFNLDLHALGRRSGKKELYECETCSKKFSRKLNLEDHRLVHEQEKQISDKLSTISLDPHRPGFSRGNESPILGSRKIGNAPVVKPAKLRYLKTRHPNLCPQVKIEDKNSAKSAKLLQAESEFTVFSLFSLDQNRPGPSEGKDLYQCAICRICRKTFDDLMGFCTHECVPSDVIP